MPTPYTVHDCVSGEGARGTVGAEETIPGFSGQDLTLGGVVRGANVFLLGFVTWAPTILALEKPVPRQTPVCRPQLSTGPPPVSWGKTILSDGPSC